jgi:hypothetical protein
MQQRYIPFAKAGHILSGVLGGARPFASGIYMDVSYPARYGFQASILVCIRLGCTIALLDEQITS